MNILITGALGYIGGRLSKYLGEKYGDKSIHLFIRDNSYIPEWVSKKKLFKGNLLNTTSLDYACKDIDVIIHLAALNEIDSAKDPVKALRVNAEGTLNILNIAIKNQVKKFIYLSTFHIYGLNAKDNITENTLPLPIHPYSITHHVSEDFIKAAHYNKDIKSIIIRLSNSFGYPAHPQVNRWSLVVNDLCMQAVLNNKMILKTSGKQHRDFITLTDVIRCIEHLIFLEDESDASNCVYNLGGEFSSSIVDMASLIRLRCNEVLGKNPDIVVGTDITPINKTPVSYNIDKIKNTGFNLLSNINEEIDETLRFCQIHQDILRCNLR